jgi:AcrR family transcriptional regulator
VSHFTRARQPEQKEERRAQLLTTARAMLDAGTPLAELSLNGLARQAGMTKSNVYRYFESREAVLLDLLRDEWFAWFVTLTTTYTPPPAGTTPLRHLAGYVARTLAARPLLCTLTSALPSVLEQNLSAAAVTEFKRLTLAFFEEAATFLAAQAPVMSAAQAQRWLLDGAVVLTGLWPHARPAPSVEQALAQAPDLAVFRWDFVADLERLLYALAADLTSSSSSSPLSSTTPSS